MNVINITPHVVNLYDQNDCNYDPKTHCYSLKETTEIITSTTFEPSGTIARCNMIETEIEPVEGFRVFETTFGEVENLPEPIPGTKFIVSAIILNAVPERTDLLVPTHTVRDKTGRVIGCCGFSGRRANEN